MNPHPDEHTYPGEENMIWGQGIKERHRVEKPQTKYWAVSEQARKMIPPENLCKMFCGGKACKYCSSVGWKTEQMVVDGLYSEWVTCNIMAMARMSSDNIKHFDMIKQLQNLQVKTVINLQQPGEHAHCGFGTHTSGFSYNPQTLMDAGLFFYNFTIQDYGVAGMTTLLDIVKVMQFAVSQGKVTVHCHAGLEKLALFENVDSWSQDEEEEEMTQTSVTDKKSLERQMVPRLEQGSPSKGLKQSPRVTFVFDESDKKAQETLKAQVALKAQSRRTGMVIACYLIYNNRVQTDKAIQYVRSRRPGAIQTKQQIKACQQFEAYLKPFFVIFSQVHAVSFNQFLTRQRHLLHGYEARKLKNIPKVIYVSCERLLELCGKGNALSSLRNTPLPADLESLFGGLTARDPSPSDQLGVEDGDYTPDTDISLHPSHSEVPGLLQEISSPSPEDVNNSQEAVDDATSTSSSVIDNDDDDDDCVVYGQIRKEYKKAQKQAEELTKMTEDNESDSDDVRSVCSGRMSETMDADSLWEAVIKMDCPAYVLQRIVDLKESLNKTEKAWQDLAREEDPLVICGVMCDWLDQLNEPVLRAQDVSALIENSSDPGRALLHLENSTKSFLEYMILVISKFDFRSEVLRQTVLEFVLSYLCQKKLNLNYVHASSRQNHFSDMKPDCASHLFHLFLNLLEKVRK